MHIWNIILHQISAKISDFFRSIAEEKVSALPKRKLRGVTPVDVRTKLAGSHINSQFSKLYLLHTHEVGIIFFKELKADCKKIKNRSDCFGILLTHFEIEAAISGLKCNI